MALSRLLVVPVTRSQAYRQLGWMVLGTGVTYGTTTSPVLCEEKKSIMDTILPKNSEGTIQWGKSASQVTDGIFWDKLLQAVGDQVSLYFLRV